MTQQISKSSPYDAPPPAMDATDSRPDQQTATFVLLFEQTSGRPRVNYFMLDPLSSARLLPKMNTMCMYTVQNVTGYKPVVWGRWLYLLGGKDWASERCSSDVRRFDPWLNSWTVCRPMAVARCRFTAEVLGGFLYVMGGEVDKRKVTDSVERYDPGADTWVTVQPMPHPRTDHASCVLGGNVYVSGGVADVRGQCTNTFWSYEPERDVWTEVEEGEAYLPQERSNHKMVAVGENKIFILSGISFDPDSYSNVDERSLCVYTMPKVREQLAQLTGKRVHIWDLNHPVIPYPRSNAAVVVLGETICVLGGFNQSKRSVCTVVHYYDTHRKRWRVGFGLPEGHYSSLDGVVLTVPDSNKSFCFNDRNLYKNWILW